MADFFDKIKDSLDKGITTVSVKSRQLIETQKIRSQIDALQRQKKTALEELGMSLYQAFLKGETFNPGDAHSKCENIRNLDGQINDREREIEEINKNAEESIQGTPSSRNVCECGVELPDNAKFCGKCGKATDVIVVGEPSSDSGRITACTSCGAQVIENAKFCQKCGTKQE